MTPEKEQLLQELIELNMDAVLSLTDRLLGEGVSAGELIGLLRQGLARVNDRCEAGHYFIADLIMANNIFREAVGRITGYRAIRRPGSEGRVLMGTVQGDIHELGKNLVAIILQNSGFETLDLGADISPRQFCDAVFAYTPDILVLSGTLSESADQMALTIQALEQAGIRSTVRVILGGSCIDEHRAIKIGADAYSNELFDCLRLCRRFVEAKE